MVHHSTDKLAKWCTTGVQGAIGARVMEPIYISSIMIGTNDAYDVQGVKLQNYLNRVLSDNMLQQSGYLAGCYMCFRFIICSTCLDLLFFTSDRLSTHLTQKP